MTSPRPLIIDNLQYCRFDQEIFSQMHQGGASAVHVTICYHEDFAETVANICQWNAFFEEFPQWIFQGFGAEDVERAHQEGRTAIFFGFQNCSPIEDNIRLIEVCHQLGVRFMQLSYNNQSLLATGCYEAEDPGITRMGKQAIAEMNRVGLVIDMSHSAERSTLEAIALSSRPVTITHANPSFWHSALRNKSDTVLKELCDSGGMLGFSLYPHHLKGGTSCTLQDFCTMIAKTAEKFGVEHFGLGSDLCQKQPDSVVSWMRNGTWSKEMDFGEGSAEAPGFPNMPDWFGGNLDFGNIADGLRAVGFSELETAQIMGENWLRFYRENFRAEVINTPTAPSFVEG